MTAVGRAARWLGGALALAAACSPPPASALTVGIGDQQATSFSDVRLRALGLRHARLVVPWDAVTSRPEVVQAWLDAVAAAGLAPQIAFEHLSSDRCPSAPCSAPSVTQYRAAVQAFHARFPQVTTFTTWNEANHQSQPVAQQPELVARYYAALRDVCPTCTVVAGDVLDSGSYVRWLQRFRAAAGEEAQLYGLHNYGDVTYGRSSGVDSVLAAVPGTLWLDETGGIVTLRDDRGRVTLSTNEARATAAINRAFSLALARPRVTRLSIYQWRAPEGAKFDAGVTRPDGTARPSYDALLRQMQALPAEVAAPPDTIAWSARWQGKRLLLRVRCGACAGRTTVTVRGVRLGVRRYTPGASVRVSPRLALRKTLRRATVRKAVLQTSGGRVVVKIPRPSRAAAT